MAWKFYAVWMLFLIRGAAQNSTDMISLSTPTSPSVLDNVYYNGSARSPRKKRIGALVEKGKLLDFEAAMSTWNISNQDVDVILRVVQNDPYDVLRAICDSFVGRREIQGLVFVCEKPCSLMTSFAGFIGLSGVVVTERRTEKHSAIFSDEPESFLDISPPPHQQNDAVIQLLIKFQWKSICLIHDNQDLHRLLVEDLETRMQAQGFKVKSKIRLDGTNGTIVAGLKSIYGNSRVFVLYCSGQNAEMVLEHANRERLTSREHAWIVGEMVLEKRYRKIPAAFPIGLIGIKYEKSGETADHIIDAINVVDYGIRHMTEHETNTNRSIGNCDDTITARPISPLYRAMKNVTLTGKTGVLSFTEEGYRAGAQYTFLNLRRTRNTRRLHWQNVGTLVENHVTLEQIIWPGGEVHTPSGVPRVRLRIVMYEVAPLLYVTDRMLEGCQPGQSMECILVTEKAEKPKCCMGMCIDLIKLLSRDLGFQPEIRTIERGRAGSFVNGKWTGIIGSVYHGEADMAMSSISITEERSKDVDFSEPFLYTGSTILVAKRHGSFRGDGFIKPFEVRVWIFVFCVLYLVAFVIFILESKNPGLQRTKHKDYRGKFDIHISIWLIYSRLFSGNLDAHVPRFVSSKVVLSSWAFSSLIAVSLYTANLAAFMVQKEQARYIDGINDSVIQNPSASVLKFTTIRDTSVAKYFRKNLPHVYKFMQKYKVNHSSQGVQAVKDGKIDAFLWEALTLERYVANDSTCSLLTVGKHFDKSGFAVALPKGSPWTRNVSEMILKYQMSNELSELSERWQKSYCQKKSSENFTIGRLGIANLEGVFYLLLAGIGLSIIVLIGETIFYTVQANRRRKAMLKKHTEPDRFKLQNEVKEVKDVLIEKETQKKLFISKMEEQLAETLQEIQTLQNWPENSQSLESVQKNDFSSEDDLYWDTYNDAMDSLTLGDMKRLIASMKEEVFKTCEVERESVL